MNPQFFKSFLFGTILITAISSSAQGIEFAHDTSFAQIRNRAIEADKPIFIDCYTSWCGPCKWMAANVFVDPAVGTFFNENFINAKIDMEAGFGRDVARWYDVNAYPTFLFLSKEGKILHRSVGGQPPVDFIETAKLSLIPGKRYGDYLAKYNEGNREKSFIREFLPAAENAGADNVSEIFDWYLSSLTKEELSSVENFELFEKLMNFLRPGFVPAMQLSQPDLIAALGKERIDRFLTKYYDNLQYANYVRVEKPVGSGQYVSVIDETKYDAFVEEVKRSDFKQRDSLLLAFEMGLFYSKEDYKSLIVLVKEKANEIGPGSFNGIAWMIYEKSDDPDELKFALDISKRSMSQPEDTPWNVYACIDTYACLCYKLKLKKEGKIYAEKAITYGKANDIDVTSTEELLVKILALK